MPVASVADAKIVCCPMANVSPEATGMLFSLNVTGTAPFTASIAEAANVTGAPAAEVASVDAGAPAATTGAVVSFTSKLKLVFAVLPARSVADARTVWLPTEKNVIPGVTGVPFSVKVTGSVPSIASLVSATKLTGEPAAAVASVADGALAVSAGAVVSSVKEIEAELSLPAASVSLAVMVCVASVSAGVKLQAPVASAIWCRARVLLPSASPMRRRRLCR